jgi:hypothetical protein
MQIHAFLKGIILVNLWKKGNRKMYMNSNCIYPLSPENLQALMDFYFPSLPPGDTMKLYQDYKKYNFELDDIEYAAIHILPMADAIQKLMKTPLTQTSLLDYAIESIILFNSANYNSSAERSEIVKSIRIKAELIESFKGITGHNTCILDRFCWN